MAARVVWPVPAAAQDAPAMPDSAEAPEAARSVAAEPRRPHETRLYFAMWTTHLKHRVITLDNNWLVGFTHRGFFGGTFTNSFGRRAFTGGLQRTLLARARGPLAISLGYRLGAITGYDGRFMRFARDTPCCRSCRDSATSTSAASASSCPTRSS
jgi:hypothetical protein